MRRPHLTRPDLLGPSRRARWRRTVLRRLGAAACIVAAMVLLVGVVRPPAAPTITVLVAARDLAAGDVLTATDLRPVQVPRDPEPKHAAGRDELLGRRVATTVRSGELLTRTRVVPRSVTDGLPAGTVAVHVLLADPGALGMLRPGDRLRLFPDTGGPPWADGVLVLSLDTPADTGSLPDGDLPGRGVVVALAEAAAERILAGQRPDGGPPRVVAVVTG